MSKLEEYLDSLGGSDATTRLHRKVLLQYCNYIKNDERRYGVKTAQNFLKKCSNRGMENVSVATYTSIIRSFLSFLGTSDKKLNAIRAPRVGFKVKRAIDEKYWKKFLLQPETLRDMTVAYVLLYGACRVGELRKIRVNDIDFDGKTIRYKGQREAKIRSEIQLNDITIDIIKEYIKEQGLKSNDHLVTLSERRIEQLVKQWAIQADIPHAEEITPHSLRRSLGKAFYYKTGKDLEKTRMMLGHKNISSTQHYLSIEEEETRADYKKYFD